MLVIKERVVNAPDLPTKLKQVMDVCLNLSKAFREASYPQGLSYAYKIAKGEQEQVSYSVLEQGICAALGTTPAALGVVFEPEPVEPLPVDSAPYDTNLLCYRKVEDEWAFCGILFRLADDPEDPEHENSYPAGWYKERDLDMPDEIWWEVESTASNLDDYVKVDDPDGWLPLPVVAGVRKQS